MKRGRRNIWGRKMDCSTIKEREGSTNKGKKIVIIKF
jgi:hypothetical protein